MKKTLLMAIVAVAFGLNANAQTVINNNYGSPIQSANGQTATVDDSDESEAISSFNLVYYGHKGFSNYGFTDYFLNPNGLGFDFGLRTNFKKNSNFNVDLGINYAFQLLKNGDLKLFFVPSIGPSLRLQSYEEFNYNSKTGKTTTKSKTGFYCDLFFNPRITINYGHIMITGGYYMWAPKFKFEDGYLNHGFNVALGWAF